MSIKNKKFFVMLFFTEMWERFGYYGMRTLLVLYLVSILGFTDQKAYSIYALFAALGYAGPVIGGLIADKLIGFRNIIKIGALVIVMGHIGMTFAGSNPLFLYASLSLIAVGTGFFKGNITTLLGACYAPTDPKRDRAFSLFYVSVNIGSFLASISCGYLAHKYGWHYGFGLAGIGMFLGLISFCKFEYLLEDVGIMSSAQKQMNTKYNTIFAVFFVALILSILCTVMLFYSELFSKLLAVAGVIVFAYLIKIASKLGSQERKNIILLMVLTFFMMLFFSLEMQLGSLYNLFAVRNVDTTLFGHQIPAASLQSLNPLSIMIFGPMLAPMFMRFGNGFSIMRVGIGIALMVISLLILYVGCLNADEQNMVSIGYLIISLSVMGAGEIFIAPLVQDLFTKLSPAHLRGFMMGVLMLSLSFANLAGNIIAMFVSVPTSDGTGSANTFESLEIYKKGFLDFSIYGIVVLAVFAVLCPLLSYQYRSNFRRDTKSEIADVGTETEDVVAAKVVA